MDILGAVKENAQGGAVEQIARRFGLDEGQVDSVLEQLVPALAGGLRQNVQADDGLAGLGRALQGGDHQRYLERPETLTDEAAVEEGNGILGHIFGSKEVSRQVAGQASSNTGIDYGIIKRILPLAATLLMGSLSKRTDGGSQLLQGNAEGGGLLGALLGGQDGGLDGLLGMAGKLFGR